MFLKVSHHIFFKVFLALILLSNLSIAGGIDGVILNTDNLPIASSKISILETNQTVESNEKGRFVFRGLQNGVYNLVVTHVDYEESVQPISISDESNKSVSITLLFKSNAIGDVIVKVDKPIGRGKEISEDEIIIGKLSVTVKPDPKKPSGNSARSIEIPVNIIEYDGAGLQLGIGGRGLNPKRTAHFNTRQNGYEISADALGYPETYYTPPSEAVKEIRILRGAASMQYGPQFGGMINFKLKEGPENPNDTFEFISNNKYGSYNQFHSFNSIGTNYKALRTYSFYHYKTGDGWRDNSKYDSHTGYTGLDYQVNEHLSLKLQLTHHQYVAQQAGGLTDKQFELNPQQSFRERNWFNVNWNIAAFIAHYKINKDLWINSKTFLVSASRNSVGFLENSTRIDDGSNRTLINGNFNNIGNETRLIKRYKFFYCRKNGAFITGVRNYRGDAKTAQGLASTGSDADFTLSKNPEYSEYSFPSNNTAAFFENSFFINDNFYITPGYRFEHINTKVDGYFNQYTINMANDTLQSLQSTNNSSNTRNIHLLGTGITYNSHKYGKFILNGSQNFRSVNFSDINIVLPGFKVDKDIKDEKGFTTDLSYTKTWNGKAFIGATAYYLYYANRIGVIWQTDDATFDTYQFRTNVSASRTVGSEITAWVDLAKITAINDSTQKLNLMTNITLNNAKYIDENTTVFGNWVEMVPAVTIKTSLTYEYKDWFISGLVNYQTQQYSEATNAEESTTGLYGVVPSFCVVDMKVGYTYKKFTFHASMNNVTDTQYFTQRASSYPGPGIIPSEGRTLFGSVIVKL